MGKSGIEWCQVTAILTARLGGIVLYPWVTVTVAVYVPAHEVTRQWTVRVRGLNN